MQTRLLKYSDLEALTELLGKQQTYFGLPIEQFPGELVSKKSIFTYTNCYLKDENAYYKAFGCFNDEGVLQGSISVDFMQDQPFWILRRIVVDEDIKADAKTVKIINELMKIAIETGEAAGYYQHLYLIPAKYKRAHSKIWGEHDLRKDRYSAVELEYVKADTPSRFRLYWELLYGRTMFPLDTVVRCSFMNANVRDALDAEAS